MPRHASFSPRLHRSGRRAGRPRGVPDPGLPDPRSDGGYVDDSGDIDAYVYVDVHVYVNANGNVNENANGNVNANSYANDHGYANDNANANANGYAHTDNPRDANLPALPHPDSGRPIVCSCRRVGCAAN